MRSWEDDVAIPRDKLPIPEHHLDLPKRPNVNQGIVSQ